MSNIRNCGNCALYLKHSVYDSRFCAKNGTDRYQQDNNTPNPYSCACGDWKEKGETK